MAEFGSWWGGESQGAQVAERGERQGKRPLEMAADWNNVKDMSMSNEVKDESGCCYDRTSLRRPPRRGGRRNRAPRRLFVRAAICSRTSSARFLSTITHHSCLAITVRLATLTNVESTRDCI